MEEKINNQYYEAYYRDKMAVIHFRDKVFELLTDIDESQALMDFIHQSEQDRAVRGLIFFNDPDCLGEAEYEKYIGIISKTGKVPEDMDSPEIVDKNIRFRQITILGRFIRSLSRYQKLFVTAVGSPIVTPFIGVVLLADFRLVGPGGAFSLAHRKYGLHPSGVIPYIFPSYTGYGKSMELQLTERIDALQGFRLGLFNQILPADQFEDNCIRYVQPFLTGCPNTLRLTRRLNSFRFNDLEDYLQLEASLLNL
jgi:enoyl-CoA hydratase/carnithine racemase